MSSKASHMPTGFASLFKKVKDLDVRELAQAFTELAALLEDLNSVPSTHIAAYSPPVPRALAPSVAP